MNTAKLNSAFIKGISRVVSLNTIGFVKENEKKYSPNYNNYYSGNKIGDFFYNISGNIEIFRESDLSKKGILVNKDA